jgi:hypothetical protein
MERGRGGTRRASRAGVHLRSEEVMIVQVQLRPYELGDPALVEEIVESFVRLGERQLGDVEAAVERGAERELERAAAALRELCTVMMATTAADLAGMLESSGRSGHLRPARELSRRLRFALAQTVAQMRACQRRHESRAPDTRSSAAPC